MPTAVLESRKEKLSPAKLALLQKRLRGEMEQIKPIHPDPERLHEPFPMTEMCEAQWMGRNNAYELGGVSAHAYAEMFDGPLDIEAFERAWNKLIDHYEMFRAIVGRDGQYRILQRDEIPYYKVEIVDLRGKPQEEVDAYLAEIRDEWRREIMPGDVWPLFKFRASILSDEVTRLHASLDLLITDIGSLQRIGKQLTRLYEDPGYDLGEPAGLTFRDYNMAITAFRKHPLYAKSEKYWLSRLDTLPPAPDLPVLRDPAKVAYPYFTHDRRIIDRDTWQRFQERSRKFGMTPDVTMNAVYADIIATWAKRSTFTLNVLSFKRLPIHRDVNKLAGNFGSTILLEVRDWGGESFVDRAKRLHHQLLQDLDHWFYSGVTLLRELNRHKGGAREASMPVVFASTLNYSVEGTLLDAENFWDKYMLQLYLQTPQVWLDHQIAEDGGELHLEWDRVEELFPEGMTRDMLDAYENLVHALANSDEPWLATSQSHILLPSHVHAQKDYNDTGAPVSGSLLQVLLTEKATEHPDHPAVISENRILSYGEVDQLSNRIGHGLREHGAKPNQLVAVVMEKGWEQAVAALGILKSGAAYLPIDPSVPTERLAYLLENGKVDLVLTQAELDQSLSWPTEVERLVVSDEALAAWSTDALDLAQSNKDIAYVIYTSGSTGQPKGVVIDHRGAVNTILDVNERFSVGTEDKVLGLSALSFDLSVYDLFGTFAAGATLVLPRDLDNPDPSYWAGLVEKEGVTIWNSVPALMELVVENVENQQSQALQSLRTVLLSGDWIPVSLPDRLRAVAGEDTQVISLGGATEASIWSILYPIDEVDPNWGSIPYGRPMRNQRFYVLGDYLDPKPLSASGDLYIGGVGLAKGYWGDEEKTAKAFITHPVTGERLYKTGDLGCLHPNGQIEFLGREDLQVKIRGFRIELGEIEAKLNEHPDVETAVVVAMGADSETRRLVAYVVARPDVEVDTEALRAFAEEGLPDYMMPASFITLEALPLTGNGKVDRKSLANPESLNQWQKSKVYIAPRNDVEREVAQIWASMLDVEKVGVEDNFFELGGTSLLVNQMAARLYDTFGVEVPMQIIFEQPHVAAMAEAIEEVRENPDAGADSVTVEDLAADAELDPSIGI